jgi:capsular polysaccharide biosynthesis protein
MMHLRRKLRSTMESAEQQGKPLYISRKDGKNTSFHRNLANEAALKERLSKYGFVTMVVSEVPPEQQIEAFSGARVMVGMHGAGLSNMVFMEDESALLELSGFPLTADFFARDAQLWGMDCFVAQSEKNGPGVDVDLHAVEKYLQYLSDRKLLQKTRVKPSVSRARIGLRKLFQGRR